MGDKIYLGTILGEDDRYYKGIFEKELTRRRNKLLSTNRYSGDVSRILEIKDGFFYIVYARHTLNTDPTILIKINKEDERLNKEIEIPSKSRGQVCHDEDSIYVSSREEDNTDYYRIERYTKSNLTRQGSYFRQRYLISLMEVDDEYIYIIKTSEKSMKKLDKFTYQVILEVSDMSMNSPSSIKADGDYIYLSGKKGSNHGNLQKFDRDTMEKVAETSYTLTEEILDFIIIGDYIYALNKEGGLQKFNKESMELIAETQKSPVSLSSIIINGESIYSIRKSAVVGDFTGDFLEEYDKQTLAFIESMKLVDETSFNSLFIDGKDLYLTPSKGLKSYERIYKLLGYERVD